MKRSKHKEEIGLLADESEVYVHVYLVGHGLKYTKDRTEANVIYLNSQGQETGYAKYISNVYGYEIRSQKRMTGACRAMIYHDTLETKLDERPVVPQAAIYAARAFEWHARSGS